MHFKNYKVNFLEIGKKFITLLPISRLKLNNDCTRLDHDRTNRNDTRWDLLRCVDATQTIFITTVIDKNVIHTVTITFCMKLVCTAVSVMLL